jgi:hypothetical protein
MYQTKDMTNVQFRNKFNILVEVIEHYGGAVSVHKNVTQNCLAKLSGGIYILKVYTPKSRSRKQTKKVRKRYWHECFWSKRINPGMAILTFFIIGRCNVYLDSRISAFALLNNWNGTYERGFNMHINHHGGSSFIQYGAKSGGIACWGFGS